MPSVGTASIDILADKQQVGHSITGAVQAQGSKMVGLGKALGASLISGFAVFKAIDFFGDTIAEAREAAKIGRDTAAVLKSTGGAAGLTVEGISKLSEKLSNLAAVDDEVVQAGANVLATFTGIRNEAGKGNDVFDQAAEAALNMSARMGTDLQGSIVQVGKALNNPIQGITALTRVGVVFTKSQKDQIKALTEAGDVMGAQKIILKELQTEFGGAAAAAADPAEKFSIAWGNAKEKIGTAILPMLEKMLTFFAAKLPGAIDSVGRVLGPVIGGFKQVFQVLFARDFVGGGPFAEDSPFIAGLFDLRDKWLPVIQKVVAFFQDNWKAALAVAGAALLALTSPITAVIVAGVLLYTKFQVVRDAIGAAVDFISEKFAQFSDFAQKIWPQVQEAISHFVNVAVGAWKLFGDDIMRIVGGVFNNVKVVVETVIGVISGIIKLGLALINGDWGKAWDALKGIVTTVWDGIKGIISGAIDIIKGYIGGAAAAIGRLASGMFDGIKNAFKSAINWVIRAWNRLEFKIPGFDPPGPGPKFGGFTLGLPNIPELHTGGVVPGIPGQEVLIKAMAGETVLPTHQSGWSPVHIENAYFQDEVDVDMFGKRLGFAVAAAGGFGG